MRPLLSFFTALPVGAATLEKAARNVYLLPLVGVFVGVPGAVVILGLGPALPPGVLATLALAAVLLAAGLHHADGVLDVGDALMVRGDPDRRRAVLKDTRVGVGGIGALFVVYGPGLAALAALIEESPGRAALALVAAEVAARSAMLVVLLLGGVAEAGSSSVPFVRSLSGWRRPLGAALALLAPLPFLAPLGIPAVLAFVSAPVTALIAHRVWRERFGGIGGDAVGATGETARTVLLVALSAIS